MINVGGRKRKLFDESSERTKRRKTESLRKTIDHATLSFATSMSLRSSGNESAAKLVNEISVNSPDRASKILKTWKDSQKANIQKKYTPEEALFFIVTENMTKSTYINMRKGAQTRHHDLYPSYENILKAKKVACPSDITITETKCEIPLQSLLNHTYSRLLETVDPSYISRNEESHLELICKYGFDGSSGHAIFKQSWTTENEGDENIFLTSVVPLRLVNKESKQIVWENPRPSSPRFCRPIRLQWLHETYEISKAEKDYIDAQIANLRPLLKNKCEVSFVVHLTMIDGKVSTLREL